MTAVLVSGAGPFQGYGAVRVTGVCARERARGPLDERALLAAHARQRELMAALCASERAAAYELRSIALPEPGRPGHGQLFLFLLVRCDGESPEAVRAAVADAIDDALAQFLSLDDTYDVAPVRSEQELWFAREPFEVRSLAELKRLEAVLEPGTLTWRRARAVGFHAQHPEDGRVAELLHHVHSWVPRARDVSALYPVLLAQPAASFLSVQVRRAAVAPELQRTRRNVLARAERWLDAHDAARDGAEARASRTLLQALVREKLAQGARLEDGSLLLRVRMAGAAPLRGAVVEAYAQFLSEPMASSVEMDAGLLRGGAQWALLEGEALEHGLTALRCLSVEPGRSRLVEGAQSELSAHFDLFEAQAAFRLPVPGTSELPGIPTRFSRFLAPPTRLPALGVRLGQSTELAQAREVRVQTDDRRRHCYVLGQSGTGKSTLFCSMVLEDIRNGAGVCVIDPHGDLIDEILLRYPKERAEDLVLFDAGDRERPLGLNPLEWSTPEEKSFLVQEMVAAMYRLFPPEMIGPMFERALRNCLLTLMAAPEGRHGTLLEVPRLFLERDYHKQYLPHIQEPHVRSFWTHEFASMSDYQRNEFLGYFVSKFERFVADPIMRNIVGQPQSAIRFQDVMDTGKVLLVDLGKGAIGELNTALLGMTLVAKLQAAAMARAQQPQEQRRDFYLYVDEFQCFASATFSTLLSEARKYRLNLVLTNQYMEQLRGGRTRDDVLSAVLGNVGTLIAMRVGVEDAELLAKYFAPLLEQADLTCLPNWHAYVSTLVDGQRLRPFSLRTVPDSVSQHPRLAEALRALSRLKFGRDRVLVEQEIEERWRLGPT